VTTHYDLIVVGEGFAGLTCAQEAAKLGLAVATFEAEFFGGLVLNVNELQHFDEAAGLSGMDHAAILAKSNAKAGVKSTNAAVSALRRAGDAFEVETDAGTHTARAVVVASGARLKKLGVAGEDAFEGRGVSHCADCDAPMFTDAKVVVAGGNDWAIHEATVLAQDAAVVYLVHEGGELQAGADSLEHLQSQPKIERIANATIEEIVGNDSGVTGVRVRGAVGTREIECAGVFPFIGLTPNSEIVPAEVPRDDNRALRVDAQLETNVLNLFAIGAVRAGFGGWLDEAVADARRAAQTVKARLG
jgi:thioredoxin reductase (NADPH)